MIKGRGLVKSMSLSTSIQKCQSGWLVVCMSWKRIVRVLALKYGEKRTNGTRMRGTKKISMSALKVLVAPLFKPSLVCHLPISKD
jgi:hypothetical protein